MSAEVQKAVYTAITTANISGVVSVRDSPIIAPVETAYPFIVLSGSTVLPEDAGGDTGKSEFIEVVVWSRSPGKKQVKDIQQAIYNALHQQTLTVTGRTSAYCWLDDERVIDMPDGFTKQGIQTFQITHRS